MAIYISKESFNPNSLLLIASTNTSYIGFTYDIRVSQTLFQTLIHLGDTCLTSSRFCTVGGLRMKSERWKDSTFPDYHSQPFFS